MSCPILHIDAWRGRAKRSRRRGDPAGAGFRFAPISALHMGVVCADAGTQSVGTPTRDPAP